MKVFIVDDEQPAREELRWLADQCDGVEVVGEAGEAQEARSRIEQLERAPEVVFVDIDMPNIDGIRFAESLENISPTPLSIFVTAYEEYAVDAFNVEAVDYLLKPVRLERFQRSIDRARRRLERRPGAGGDRGSGSDDASDPPLQRISVRDGDQYRVVETDDILFFESVDGDVFVETDEGRFPTEFSLKILESRLDPKEFFRCHRSYIVRIDAIENIVPTGAGTYRLQLATPDDRSEAPAAPLARSRAPELKRRMPWSANMLDE